MLGVALDALSLQQQAVGGAGVGGAGVGLRAHQYAADLQCQGIGSKISVVRNVMSYVQHAPDGRARRRV